MTEEIKRLEWIVYKGVTIARTNFMGLEGQAVIDQMNVNLAQLLEKANGVQKSLLLLTHTNVPLTGDLYTKIREVSQILAPFVLARAVVGVSRSRKFIVNALNAVMDYPVKAFDEDDKALEWLLEQSVIRRPLKTRDL